MIIRKKELVKDLEILNTKIPFEYFLVKINYNFTYTEIIKNIA